MHSLLRFGSKTTILLATLLSIASESNAQSCQNGGTFDNILFECRCPATAYGGSCESLFSVSSPCFNLSAIPIIRDTTGVHAAGNGVTSCGGSCVNYDTLPGAGRWYRVQSPNGNYIVTNYPCGPIGCGTASPYTLRQLVQEFKNENGTLYSAKAYRFDTAFSSCFSTGTVSYSVRLLICPSNDTVYFLTPTNEANQRYCIGVNVATTTTLTTTATTTTTTTPTTSTTTTTITPTTPTTPQTTTTTPTTATTATATTTTTTPTATTPQTTTTTTTATTTATRTTTASTPASNTSGLISRQQWNIVANDSAPYVKVSLNSATTAASLVCKVRSNSARSSLSLETVGNPTDGGRSVYCDLKPVLHWLTANASLYVNCRVEVMDIITEVTVCQIRFNDKEVRYVDNRGQCITTGFTESDAGFWQKWFGHNSP